MGKEGPKDRLEMGFQESQLEQRRSQRQTRDSFKRANLGKEGPQDRLEMVSKRANFGKEGPKDRLEMVSREPRKEGPQG